MRLQLKESEANPVVHLNTSSLKATFEECMVEVEEKLMAYASQAEEYRKDSIDGLYTAKAISLPGS